MVIPETSLDICPSCGVELVVRLGKTGSMACMGYIFPVHPKPHTLDYELCPEGDTPVVKIPLPPVPRPAAIVP